MPPLLSLDAEPRNLLNFERHTAGGAGVTAVREEDLQNSAFTSASHLSVGLMLSSGTLLRVCFVKMKAGFGSFPPRIPAAVKAL